MEFHKGIMEFEKKEIVICEKGNQSTSQLRSIILILLQNYLTIVSLFLYPSFLHPVVL